MVHFGICDVDSVLLLHADVSFLALLFLGRVLWTLHALFLANLRSGLGHT